MGGFGRMGDNKGKEWKNLDILEHTKDKTMVTVPFVLGGNRFQSFSTLSKIAKVLGISMDDLAK